jgi:hypothetical protein
MRLSWRPSRRVAAASFLLLALYAWRLEAIAGQLTATWDDNSTNELGFSIERSLGPSNTFAEVATTGSGTTTYTDSSLADATTYCYRVRAFNAAGYSSYSNVACGTTPQTFGLAVVMVGLGSGTVVSAPAGITCGASCSASYSAGTTVTLTATPAGGSAFTGWSGAACSGTGPCTVTMTAGTTVTAGFDLQSIPLTLAVSKAGTGSGTVTSAPPGIACGSTCSWNYLDGTTVILTATPAVDSTFVGWSGGGCSGTGSCTMTLTGTATVTATFSLPTVILTVGKAGTGSGTITSAPAGIDCGSTCSASYSTGSSVTLTAAAAAGSTFTGWSGGGCSGTGSCTVNLGGAITVTAIFDPNSSVAALYLDSGAYSARSLPSKVPITVFRSGSMGRAVTVRYATSNGTATAGVDYLATSGTLKFKGGVTKNTFYVLVLQSGTTTPRTINVSLSRPSHGAVLGTPSTAVLTLTNVGPVAAYSFDEGVGTTVGDSSGNNNTGTLMGGPVWLGGEYGSGLSFDGVNDYVDLGNPPTLQLTRSMTISAWINSAAFPIDDAAIVSKRTSGEIGYQLDTTVDNGTRTIGFKLTSSSGAQMFRYGATTLQINQWYHVAGVYDAAAQTLTVYLNGQVDNGLLVGPVTTSQQNSSLGVNIGRRAGLSGFEFKGMIDQVRIYNRALGASEIQQEMNTPL